MSHLPETDAATARQAQVVAYAVTHRGWTVSLACRPIPEADILRACYGIGDATADEWAVIQGYIVPKRPYRSVCRDGFWRIVANDGTEFPLPVFEDCTDAWRHVDRLRGVIHTVPVIAAEIRPPRLSERRERGH